MFFLAQILSFPTIILADTDPDFAFEEPILSKRVDSNFNTISQNNEIFIREYVGGTTRNLIRSYNVSNEGKLIDEQSIVHPDLKPWVWRNFFTVSDENLIIFDGNGNEYTTIGSMIPYIYRKNASGKWEYNSVLEDRESTSGYEHYAGIEKDIIVIKRNIPFSQSINDQQKAALIFYQFLDNKWQKIDEAEFPQSKQYFGYSLTLENGVALYTHRAHLMVFKQVAPNDWEFSNNIEYPQSPTYNLEISNHKLRLTKQYEECSLGLAEEYQYSFSFIHYKDNEFVDTEPQCLTTPSRFPISIFENDLFTQHRPNESTSYKSDERGYFLRHHKLVNGNWVFKGTIQSSSWAENFNSEGSPGFIGRDLHLINERLFANTTYNISGFSKGDALKVTQTYFEDKNVYNNDKPSLLSYSIENLGSEIIEDIKISFNVPLNIALESTNQNCNLVENEAICEIPYINGLGTINLEIFFSIIRFAEEGLTLTTSSPKGTAYSDDRTITYSFITNDVPRVTNSTTTITNEEYIEFVLDVEDENNVGHKFTFLNEPLYGFLSTYHVDGEPGYIYTPYTGRVGVERLEYFASDQYSDSNVAVLEIAVTSAQENIDTPIELITVPSSGGAIDIYYILILFVTLLFLRSKILRGHSFRL
jgi:hypothetical protein